MTAFLTRASQQYNARLNPYVVNATIPVGMAKPVRGVKATISHAAGAPWPIGPVAEISLTGPDGRLQGFSFSGGQEVFRGVEINYRACVWEIPTGELFPAGAYTMSFKVLQDVTASLLIEYFQ